MGRKKKVLLGVEVIDMGERGTSIGRTSEGEVVIVQKDVVPGDKIDMVVQRKKKGLKMGFPIRIIELSQDRVEPFCRHFGVCGGCKWQNLAYAKQLEYKEGIVREAICRLAKEDSNKVKSIVPSEITSEYRNKIEYTFSSKRWLTKSEIASGKSFAQSSALGFHVSGSFDKVVDIYECHLQDSFGNKIKNFIRQFTTEKKWSYYDIRQNHGFLRNIVIRSSTLDQWMVTVVFGVFESAMIQELLDNLIIAFPGVNSWNYMINTKMNSSLLDIKAIHYAGSDHITEKLGALFFRISPKSFFQTNSYQAVKLYDTVLKLANPGKDDIVYDLYTGTGTIACYFANFCKKVVGVEEVEDAIFDARKNAVDNHVKNIVFEVGDVQRVLEDNFILKFGSPTIILTDPPRSGMHANVIAAILELSPSKIVYVSCNPATQARDILMLKKKYELIKVVPLDMFPHTSHIESIALLHLDPGKG